MPENLLKSIIQIEVRDLDQIEKGLNKIKSAIENTFQTKSIANFEKKVKSFSETLKTAFDASGLKQFSNELGNVEKKVDQLSQKISTLSKAKVSPKIELPVDAAIKKINSLVASLERLSSKAVSVPLEFRGSEKIPEAKPVTVPIVPDVSKFEETLQKISKKAQTVIEVDLRLSSSSIETLEKALKAPKEVSAEIRLPDLEKPVSDLQKRLEKLSTTASNVVSRISDIGRVLSEPPVTGIAEINAGLEKTSAIAKKGTALIKGLISEAAKREAQIGRIALSSAGETSQALSRLEQQYRGIASAATGVSREMRALFEGMIHEVKRFTTYQGETSFVPALERSASVFENLASALATIEDRTTQIRSLIQETFDPSIAEKLYGELQTGVENLYLAYVKWGELIQSVSDQISKSDVSVQSVSESVRSVNSETLKLLESISGVASTFDRVAAEVDKATVQVAGLGKEAISTLSTEGSALVSEITDRGSWLVNQMYDATIQEQESIQSLAESIHSLARPISDVLQVVNSLGGSFREIRVPVKNLAIDLTKMSAQYMSMYTGEKVKLFYPEVFRQSSLSLKKLANETENFSRQLTKVERVFGAIGTEDAEIDALYRSFKDLEKSVQTVNTQSLELFDVLKSLQGVTSLPEFFEGLQRAATVMETMQSEISAIEEAWKLMIKASNAEVGTPLRRLFDEFPQIKDMFGKFTDTTFGVWKLFLSDLRGSTKSSIGLIQKTINTLFSGINLESFRSELAKGIISEEHLRTLTANFEKLGIDINRALILKPEVKKSYEEFFKGIESLEQKLRFARRAGMSEQVIQIWEDAVKRLKEYERETVGLTKQEKELFEQRLRASAELKAARVTGAPKEVLQSLQNEVKRLEQVALEAETAKKAKDQLLGSQLDLSKVSKLVDAILQKEAGSLGKTKSAIFSFNRALRTSVREIRRSFSEQMAKPGFYETLAQSLTGKGGVVDVSTLVEPYIELFDKVGKHFDTLFEGLGRRVSLNLTKIPSTAARGKVKEAASRISRMIGSMAEQVRGTTVRIPWESALGVDKQVANVLRETFTGIFLSLQDISTQMETFAKKGGTLRLTRPISRLRSSLTDMIKLVRDVALQGRLTPESLVAIQGIMTTLSQVIQSVESGVGLVDAANKRISAKVKSTGDRSRQTARQMQQIQRIMNARIKGLMKSTEYTGSQFRNLMQSTYRAILESMTAPGTEIDFSRAIEEFVMPILEMRGPMRAALLKAFSQLTLSSKKAIADAVAAQNEELATALQRAAGRVGVVFKYPVAAIAKEIARAFETTRAGLAIAEGFEKEVVALREGSDRVVPEIASTFQGFAKSVGNFFERAMLEISNTISDPAVRHDMTRALLVSAANIKEAALELEKRIEEGKPIDLSRFKQKFLDEIETLAQLKVSPDLLEKLRANLDKFITIFSEEVRVASAKVTGVLSPRSLERTAEAFEGAATQVFDKLILRIEEGFQRLSETVGYGMEELRIRLETLREIGRRRKVIPEEILGIPTPKEREAALKQWREQAEKDYLDAITNLGGNLTVSMEPYIREIGIQIPGKYVRGIKQNLDALFGALKSEMPMYIKSLPSLSELMGKFESESLLTRPGAPLEVTSKVVKELDKLLTSNIRKLAPDVYEAASELMQSLGKGLKTVEIEPEVKSVIERLQNEFTRLVRSLRLPGRVQLVRQLGLDVETSREITYSLRGVGSSLGRLLSLWKQLASGGVVSQKALASATVSLEEVYASALTALDALYKEYERVKTSLKERPSIGLVKQISYIADTQAKLEGVIRVVEKLGQVFAKGAGPATPKMLQDLYNLTAQMTEMTPELTTSLTTLLEESAQKSFRTFKKIALEIGYMYPEAIVEGVESGSERLRRRLARLGARDAKVFARVVQKNLRELTKGVPLGEDWYRRFYRAKQGPAELAEVMQTLFGESVVDLDKFVSKVSVDLDRLINSFDTAKVSVRSFSETLKRSGGKSVVRELTGGVLGIVRAMSQVSSYADYFKGAKSLAEMLKRMFPKSSLTDLENFAFQLTDKNELVNKQVQFLIDTLKGIGKGKLGADKGARELKKGLSLLQNELKGYAELFDTMVKLLRERGQDISGAEAQFVEMIAKPLTAGESIANLITKATEQLKVSGRRRIRGLIQAQAKEIESAIGSATSGIELYVTEQLQAIGKTLSTTGVGPEVAKTLGDALVNLFSAYGAKIPEVFVRTIRAMTPEMRSAVLSTLKETLGGLRVEKIVEGTQAIYGRKLPIEQYEKLTKAVGELISMMEVDSEILTTTSDVLDRVGISSEKVASAIEAVIAGTKKQAPELDATAQAYNRVANAINSLIRAMTKLTLLSEKGLGRALQFEGVGLTEEIAKEYKRLVSEFYSTDEKTLIAHRIKLLEQLQNSYHEVATVVGESINPMRQGVETIDSLLRRFTGDLEAQALVFETVTGMYNRFSGAVNKLIEAFAKLSKISTEGLSGVFQVKGIAVSEQLAKEYKRLTSEYVKEREKPIIQERIALLKQLQRVYNETAESFGKSLGSVEKGVQGLSESIGKALKAVLGTQERLGRSIGVEEAIRRYYKLADAVNKATEAFAKSAVGARDPVKAFESAAKEAQISERQLAEKVLGATEKLAEQMSAVSKKTRAMTSLEKAVKETAKAESAAAEGASKVSGGFKIAADEVEKVSKGVVDVGKSFEIGSKTAKDFASEIENMALGVPVFEDLASMVGQASSEFESFGKEASVFRSAQELISNFAIQVNEMLGSLRPEHLRFLTEEDWARMLPIEYIQRVQEALFSFEGDLTEISRVISTLGERFGFEAINTRNAEELSDYLDKIVGRLREATRLDFSKRFSEGFSKVTIAASETLKQAELLFEVIQQIARGPREETPSWFRRAVATEIYSMKASIDTMLVELRKLGEGAGVDTLIQQLEVLRRNLSKSEGAVVSMFDRMSGVIRNAKDSFVNLIAYQTRWFLSTMVFWTAFETIQDLVFSLGNFEQQVRRVARVTRDAAGNIMGVPPALRALAHAGFQSAKAMESIFQAFSRTVISQSLITSMQQLGVSSEESAEAMYQLGSAGLNLNEQIAALIPTLQLVIGTEGDMREVTKLVAGIYNVYGQTMLKGASISEKFAHIADVLATVFRDHQVEISELVSGYQYAISSAQLAGLTFEQLSAILGVLNDKMIKGSKAGRSFNEVIAHAAKYPGKFAAALNAVLEAKRGIKLEELFPKGLEGKSLFDILVRAGKELQKSFDNTELSIESLGKVLEAAGIVGGRSLAALLLHANEVEESFDRIRFSSSYAAKYLSEEFVGSIQWSFKRIRGYLQGLVSYYINFFGNFFRTFSGMISKTSESLSKIGISGVFQQDVARLAALAFMIENVAKVMFGRQGIIPGFYELSSAVRKVIELPINVFTDKVEALARLLPKLAPRHLIASFRDFTLALATAPEIGVWEDLFSGLYEQWDKLVRKMGERGTFAVMVDSFRLALKTMSGLVVSFLYKMSGYFKFPVLRSSILQLTRDWLAFLKEFSNLSTWEAFKKTATLTFTTIRSVFRAALDPKYAVDFARAASAAFSELTSTMRAAGSIGVWFERFVKARVEAFQSMDVVSGATLESLTRIGHRVTQLESAWRSFGRTVKESGLSFRTLAAAAKVAIAEITASFTKLRLRVSTSMKSLAVTVGRSFKAIATGLAGLAADIIVSLGIGAIISKLTDMWSKVSEGSEKAFRDAARATQDFFATFSENASRSAQVGKEYSTAVKAIGDALSSVDIQTGQVEDIEKLRSAVEKLTYVTGFTELRRSIDELSREKPTLDIEEFKRNIQMMSRFIAGLREDLLDTFSPDSRVMRAFNESVEKSIEAIDRIAPHLRAAVGEVQSSTFVISKEQVQDLMVNLKVIGDGIRHLSVDAAETTEKINLYFARMQIRFVMENLRKQTETLLQGLGPLLEGAASRGEEVSKAFNDFVTNATSTTLDNLLNSFSFLDARTQSILNQVASNVEKVIDRLVKSGVATTQVISSLMAAGLSEEQAQLLINRWKSLTEEQRKLAIVAAILTGKFTRQTEEVEKSGKKVKVLADKLVELNEATLRAALSNTEFVKSVAGISGASVDLVASLEKARVLMEGFGGKSELMIGASPKAQEKAYRDLVSTLESLGVGVGSLVRQYTTAMGTNKKLLGDFTNLLATTGVASLADYQRKFESVFGKAVPKTLLQSFQAMQRMSKIATVELPRLLTEISKKNLQTGKELAQFLRKRYPNAPAEALKKVSMSWDQLTESTQKGILTQVIASQYLGATGVQAYEKIALALQNFVTQSKLAEDALKRFQDSFNELTSIREKAFSIESALRTIQISDAVTNSWEKFSLELENTMSVFSEKLPQFLDYSKQISPVLDQLGQHLDQMPKNLQDSYWNMTKNLASATQSMVGDLSRTYKELSDAERRYIQNAEKFADKALEIQTRVSGIGVTIASEIGSAVAKFDIEFARIGQYTEKAQKALENMKFDKAISVYEQALGSLEELQKSAVTQAVEFMKKADEEEINREKAKIEAKIRIQENYLKELENKKGLYAKREREAAQEEIDALKRQLERLSSAAETPRMKEFREAVEGLAKKGKFTMEELISVFERVGPTTGKVGEQFRGWLERIKEANEKYKELGETAEDVAKKAEEDARRRAEEIENQKQKILNAVNELIKKLKELIALLKQHFELMIKDNLNEVKRRIDAVRQSRSMLEGEMSKEIKGPTTEGITVGTARLLTEEEQKRIDAFVDKARDEEIRKADEWWREVQAREKQHQEELRQQRLQFAQQTIRELAGAITGRAVLGLPPEEDITSAWQSIEDISKQHAEALRNFFQGLTLTEEQKGLVQQLVGDPETLRGVFDSLKAGFSESLDVTQIDELRTKLQNFLTGIEQMEPVLLKAGWDEASLATFQGEIAQMIQTLPAQVTPEMQQQFSLIADQLAKGTSDAFQALITNFSQQPGQARAFIQYVEQLAEQFPEQFNKPLSDLKTAFRDVFEHPYEIQVDSSSLERAASAAKDLAYAIYTGETTPEEFINKFREFPNIVKNVFAEVSRLYQELADPSAAKQGIEELSNLYQEAFGEPLEIDLDTQAAEESLDSLQTAANETQDVLLDLDMNVDSSEAEQKLDQVKQSAEETKQVLETPTPVNVDTSEAEMKIEQVKQQASEVGTAAVEQGLQPPAPEEITSTPEVEVESLATTASRISAIVDQIITKFQTGSAALDEFKARLQAETETRFGLGETPPEMGATPAEAPEITTQIQSYNNALSSFMQQLASSSSQIISEFIQNLGQAVSGEQMGVLFSTAMQGLSESFANSTNAIVQVFSQSLATSLSQAFGPEAITQAIVSPVQSALSQIPADQLASQVGQKFVNGLVSAISTGATQISSAFQKALSPDTLGKSLGAVAQKAMADVASKIAKPMASSFESAFKQGFMGPFNNLKQEIEKTAIKVNIDISNAVTSLNNLSKVYDNLRRTVQAKMHVSVDVSGAISAMNALKSAADAAYRAIRRAQSARSRRRGFSLGGLIPGFQEGGEVFSFSTTSPFAGRLPGFGGGDNKLIAVEGGEYVIRKEAVQSLGTAFFDSLNRLSPKVSEAVKNLQDREQVKKLSETFMSKLPKNIVEGEGFLKWLQAFDFPGIWRFVHPKSPSYLPKVLDESRKRIEKAKEQYEQTVNHWHEFLSQRAREMLSSRPKWPEYMKSPLERFRQFQDIFRSYRPRFISPMERMQRYMEAFHRRTQLLMSMSRPRAFQLPRPQTPTIPTLRGFQEGGPVIFEKTPGQSTEMVLRLQVADVEAPIKIRDRETQDVVLGLRERLDQLRLLEGEGF